MRLSAVHILRLYSLNFTTNSDLSVTKLQKPHLNRLCMCILNMRLEHLDLEHDGALFSQRKRSHGFSRLPEGRDVCIKLSLLTALCGADIKYLQQLEKSNVVFEICLRFTPLDDVRSTKAAPPWCRNPLYAITPQWQSQTHGCAGPRDRTPSNKTPPKRKFSAVP